jgi:glycosyltransferase involved in cell wall biosynthesis
MPPVEISVVVPVYNSAATIPELCKRLHQALDAIGGPFEMVLVNDGSRDESGKALRLEAEKDQNIRVVQLVRNFGQHAALTAGMAQSRGQWVVLTDDDMQNPPEEIAQLYAKAQEGYDMVVGARAVREDTLVRRVGSTVASRLMKRFFGPLGLDAISAFRIISRRMVDDYVRFGEHHAYVAGLLAWLGYRQTSIPIRHEASHVGRSRYSYWRLARVLMEIIVGFSDAPLTWSAWAGAVAIVFALLFALAAAFGLVSLMQWWPVFEALLFGALFFGMAILGTYLGRVLREVRGRPFYLIDYEQSVRVERDQSRGVAGLPSPSGRVVGGEGAS